MRKLILRGLRRLEYMDLFEDDISMDLPVFKVRCCAVCRTDAKMWSQHRDLHLPRVPGHEMVLEDDAEIVLPCGRERAVAIAVIVCPVVKICVRR